VARLDIGTFNLILIRTMQINSFLSRRPLVATRSVAVGRRWATKAFTMMELLVVLAILALLAGLAITNVGGIFGGAQQTAAQLFVKDSMKSPLFTYKMHMGDYPTTADGLQALVTAPSARGDRWHGPYITDSKVPIDPWGEPYQYAYPGSKNKKDYDLWSKGPDKQSGTEDDIGNWDAPSAAK
jgi:general secretion pathway protein G